MNRPDRPIAADWLALRQAADTRARDRAAWLVDRCRAAIGPRNPVVVVDVGAGTGANQAYLAPRLGAPTRWVLLDRDRQLLAAAGNDGNRRIVGGVGELASIVADYDADLVTASALLDLLTEADLDQLVQVLEEHRVPGLFALSVDGSVGLEPPNEADEMVADAFNAHQRRAGRLGPAAAAYLEARCVEHGLQVVRAETPWVLGPTSAALARRLLTERVEAAVEQRGELAPRAVRWLDTRLTQLDAGLLTLVVGHVDLLVTPGDTDGHPRQV